MDMEKSLAEKYGGEYICTSCGYIGDPERHTKGSFLIEIILWFFFLIPGLIYTIWRHKNRYSSCPQCDKETMIPLDTPRGRKLIKSLKIKPVERAETRRKNDTKNWKGKLLALFIVLSVVAIALAINQTENITPPQTSSSNEDRIVGQGKLLDRYGYSILQKKEEDKFVAVFEPFLPRQDAIVIGAMIELINQIYGKHKVKTLTPSIVEKNGMNTFMFGGIDGNYFFLPVKEDTGEVNSFIFWKE